jgi:hypothetical protein
MKNLSFHAWCGSGREGSNPCGQDVCRFGAAAYVPSLTLEKPLFVRERNDGLYRPITYLLSKLLDEILIAVVASLLFSLVVFYLVDLQGEFVVFWIAYLATLTCGINAAYLVATLAPNMDVANAALPAYTVCLTPHSSLFLYDSQKSTDQMDLKGSADIIAAATLMFPSIVLQRGRWHQLQMSPMFLSLSFTLSCRAKCLVCW